MRYRVNQDFLNVESAAAVVKALAKHSGESYEFTIALIKDALHFEDDEPIEVLITASRSTFDNALVHCIDF